VVFWSGFTICVHAEETLQRLGRHVVSPGKPNPDCLLSHAGRLRYGYNNPQWLPDSKV